MTKLQEGICGAMKHVIGIRENAFLNIIYSNVCTNRLSLTKFPSLTTTKKMSSFLQETVNFLVYFLSPQALSNSVKKS